jgi:branched-chain amino acid transport system substrate-binding protein
MLLLTMASCTENRPVKIGFVGSITGRFSELGITARNTLQLLTEEQNKSGGIKGRNIELIIKDDQSSPARAKAAITELIDDDVRLILGPITSSMAEATTEAIAGRNVLVMSPTMSTDFLADKDDNLLRTARSSTGQADSLAQKVNSLGLSNVAIVYDIENKKYTTSIKNRFITLMTEAGKNIPAIIEFSSSDNPDFTSMASKIAASKADAVLFITNGFDGAMLAQAIRKTGLEDISFFGVSWTQSNDIITHGGRAVEGMRLIGLHDYDNVDPEIFKIKKQYIDRYHKEPSFIFTRYAGIFDIAMFGLENSDSDDPAQIKSTILKQREFNIAGRHIVFNKYGDVQEGYNIIIIKQGKFVNDI